MKFLILLTFAIGMASAAGSAELGPEDKGTPASIAGWLRDAACLMRYKQVTKPLNDCPMVCAKAGSPLVIATRDGKLYAPISATMPESDIRPMLMPHVGKYVRVSGRVFGRSGMEAIAVEKVSDVAEPTR